MSPWLGDEMALALLGVRRRADRGARSCCCPCADRDMAGALRAERSAPPAGATFNGRVLVIGSARYGALGTLALGPAARSR